MPNLQKKLASNLVLLTVVDFTKVSDALVAKELSLLKGKTDLCLAYSTLNPSQRKKSLIYRSLKKVFNLSIYKYYTAQVLEQLSRKAAVGARTEEHAQQHQEPPGKPLEIGAHDAGHVGDRAGSDQEGRPDVGAEDRQSYVVPGQGSPAEEQVFLCALVAQADPRAQPEEDDDVDDDDGKIEGLQSFSDIHVNPGDGQRQITVRWRAKQDRSGSPRNALAVSVSRGLHF